MRGVGRRDRRAPRPGQQVDLRDASARQDVIDDCPEILHRHVGVDDRPVLSRRLGHLGRTRGPPVAAHVHQVDVISALGDVVHPRQAIELEIERRFGRVGRAVDEQDDSIGRESRHPFWALVANVELDPGVAPRDLVAFADQLHRLGDRRRGEEESQHSKDRDGQTP